MTNRTSDHPPRVPHPDEGQQPPRPSLAARLRAYFLAGVLVTAPLSITLYIAWLFIDFVDSQMTPLIPDSVNPRHWGVPGVGVLMAAGLLTLIGALTAGIFGRVWLQSSEALVARMPVLSGIYGAVKQVFETLLAHKSGAFREVVLIEYPRRGVWTLAFITGTTTGEVRRVRGEEMVNVFVPTTPNPTSGFLLFLPRNDVRVLKMAVDDGIKMVISGGIITPADEG